MTDFYKWHKKHGVNTLGATRGSEREFLVWQACAEQYEARLKVAEDALDYIKTVNISSARCGEVASEALNKIRGEK